MLNALDHSLGNFQDLNNVHGTDAEALPKSPTSDYYSFEDLKDKSIPNHSFKYNVLHLNIQSLPAKFEKLKNLIHDCDQTGICLDFLLICETFLTDNITDQYNLPGYNLVYKNRSLKKKGGVAIYVKNKYNFILRDDLSVFQEGVFESVFIEIKTNECKAIVGEIYRVPNTNITKSLETYDTILQKLQNYKHTIFIGTDQNINLLNQSLHEKTNDFLNMIYSSQLLPSITKPTRVTDHSATLIDNIYISCKNPENSLSGIIVTDISDHFPIFTLVEKCKPERKTPLTYTYRPMNKQCKDHIKETLSNINWDFIDTMPVAEAYDAFHNIIDQTIQTIAPLKTITISQKSRCHEPWLTRGILKSAKKMQKLYQSQIKLNREHPLSQRFIIYRNIFNKAKRKAKRDYYGNLLKDNMKNIRKTWQILRAIIGKQKDKNEIIQSIRINNREYDDPQIIAEGFCNYFTNVGPTLASNIPNSLLSPQNFLKNRNNKTLFLSPTDTNEISNIITKMKNKNSCGFDGISSSLLKYVSDSILCPLTALVNKSLEEGQMPNILKQAKVIPIFKKNDKMEMENYRPISLLPTVSKIFEKVVYKRLYNFLNCNSVFYSGQYGFRPGYSTCDAVAQLAHAIYDSFEKNEMGIGVFLDLSKAFDTIDHNILLYKLEWYGVRGRALDWFRNYLSDRTQYVHLSNKTGTETNSVPRTLTHGVPQGSILGPLLFLIYINDLPNSLNSSTSILFADDTSLYKSSSNIRDVFTSINNDLKHLYDWFMVNRLSLNKSKSYYIIFNKKANKMPIDLKVTIDNCNIFEKTSIKFLGVIVDNQLNWHEHINSVAKKLSSALYGINKVKFILTPKELKILYYALAHPFIDYGLALWGNTHISYLNKIIILQKKILRTINGAKYNEHTNTFFYNMNILKVPELYTWQLGKYMYRSFMGSLPHYLQICFMRNKDLHNYQTRHQLNLCVPSHKKNLFHKSLFCNGPVVWNSLDQALKTLTTMTKFKKQLKKRLIASYQ